LAVYPDRLESSTVAADGTLTLTFSSGAGLSVPPLLEYEAWQVNGPDGYLVVSSGRAELTVWEAVPA